MLLVTKFCMALGFLQKTAEMGVEKLRLAVKGQVTCAHGTELEIEDQTMKKTILMKYPHFFFMHV